MCMEETKSFLSNQPALLCMSGVRCRVRDWEVRDIRRVTLMSNED